MIILAAITISIALTIYAIYAAVVFHVRALARSRELAKANGGEAGARAEARGARFWAEILVNAADGAEPLPSRRQPVLLMMGPGRRRRWLARLLTGWRMPCAAVPVL